MNFYFICERESGEFSAWSEYGLVTAVYFGTESDRKIIGTYIPSSSGEMFIVTTSADFEWLGVPFYYFARDEAHARDMFFRLVRRRLFVQGPDDADLDLVGSVDIELTTEKPATGLSSDLLQMDYRIRRCCDMIEGCLNLASESGAHVSPPVFEVIPVAQDGRSKNLFKVEHAEILLPIQGGQ